MDELIDEYVSDEMKEKMQKFVDKYEKEDLQRALDMLPPLLSGVDPDFPDNIKEIASEMLKVMYS